MRSMILLFAVAMMFAGGLAAEPPAAEVVVTFEANAVVASGVAPGARVVFFGIAHESPSYHLKVVQFERVLVDDDRDGVVRYELGRPAVREALWVVVDIGSGRRGVARVAGDPSRKKPLPPTAFRRADRGLSARAVGEHQVALFWYIRPGLGAWAHRQSDGSTSDDDGAVDGNATAALARFRAIEEMPPIPSDFAAGDLLFVVDPLTLEIAEGQHGQ